MDYFRASAISAAGMQAQMTRVEAAALNLANMHNSIAPGSEGYRPVKAVIHAAPVAFSRALDGRSQTPAVVGAELVSQFGLAPRTLYEPGHPHADAAGMVAYPAVDQTQEMMTVMTALRAYEANLAVLHVTRMLAVKALEIGAQ